MERHFEEDLNEMKERLLWSAAACCRFSGRYHPSLGSASKYALNSIPTKRN